MSSFEQELATGLAAVRQAAAVCRRVQSSITSESLEKKDKSPVTVADFASQALICRALQEAFPADPVIGEEGAAELRDADGRQFLASVTEFCNDAGVSCTAAMVCNWIDRGGLQEYRPRFWTLDPIDGTKGFLRGDQYAISLSLIVNGQIQVGILGCPNMPTDEGGTDCGLMAWAVRGEGSFLQALDAPNSKPARLSVSATSSSADACLCESVESGHSSHSWSGQIAHQLNITREPFRIDSQCKYLAVAMGNADIYLRLPTRKGYQEKIWDHAGGVIVVEEAGGKVTDISGVAPDFTHGATLAVNRGMVVSNGQFHDAVIRAVMNNVPSDV